MTDYEYILQQCRKYHFTKWDDEELRKCVDKLAGLPRQELTALYYIGSLSLILYSRIRWDCVKSVLKKQISKI